jgi:hypothetical protein
MPQLIGAIIVIYLVILFIVYVVIPVAGGLLAVGLALLASVAIAGFVSGVFVGFKNFFDVLIEAHRKLP